MTRRDSFYHFAWDPHMLCGMAKTTVVTSAGVAIRANLFGLLTTEFDFSKPFQRPGRA